MLCITAGYASFNFFIKINIFFFFFSLEGFMIYNIFLIFNQLLSYSSSFWSFIYVSLYFCEIFPKNSLIIYNLY